MWDDEMIEPVASQDVFCTANIRQVRCALDADLQMATGGVAQASHDRFEGYRACPLSYVGGFP